MASEGKKLLYRDEVVARLGEEAPMKATPGTTEVEVDPDRITITETAAAEIKRQRDKRGTPDGVIRIGIRGGGCTGFSYLFDWDDKGRRDNDIVIEQHGVTVLCDPKSFNYLKGMELDFQTSMMGYGFKFNNPNAKGACGCGESVMF
jgi:iron-sulfur cluster assembly protein